MSRQQINDTSDRLIQLNRKILAICRTSITTPNSRDLNALCDERDLLQAELQRLLDFTFDPITGNERTRRVQRT